MRRGIQYRMGPTGVVTARLGDGSIFALQQAINNAEIAQANAESTGDAAGAAAANALANSLHAQMSTIYANVTPPDKVAQVTAVLNATAPTAPVVIAAPPRPPAPAPPAAAPILENESRVTPLPGPILAVGVAAPPPDPSTAVAPAINVPWWVWAIAGGAALYLAVK